MKIDTKTVNDILKRIRDYCESNYSCEGCPFLSLDVETSSRLDIPSCDLNRMPEFEPYHSLAPYQWPVEDWLQDDEDVDSEDESEEEDDTILPW